MTIPISVAKLGLKTNEGDEEGEEERNVEESKLEAY